MYIENIAIKKRISSWLLFMFWIISIMIIVGGLTRLTDSGLSITEWELFAGFLPPLSENAWNKYFDLYKEIPEYKLQNFDMTLKEFKVIFWWEWIHRFLGRLIGISFLIPLIYFTYLTSFKKMKSSFKFCVIATGEYDLYVAEPRASEWDIAAGHAILKNAGGIITDFEGNEILYGKKDFKNPSLIVKRSKDL